MFVYHSHILARISHQGVPNQSGERYICPRTKSILDLKGINDYIGF